MEFLQRDSTDLLKYARDVNCHFASKKCKDVIVAARKLMTSKMHNTVKVSRPQAFLALNLHHYFCHSKFFEVVIHSISACDELALHRSVRDGFKAT